LSLLLVINIPVCLPLILRGNGVLSFKGLVQRIREILEDRNVQEPFDQIFFTTWSDDGVVNYSKSLVELLTEAVVDSEPPSVRAHGGLFGARGVTSEDLHINIEMQIIDEALMVVYKHIKQTEQDD